MLKGVFEGVSDLLKAHTFFMYHSEAGNLLVFHTAKCSFGAVERDSFLSCICSELLLDSKACV